MKNKKIINYVVDWLKNNLREASQRGFVVGVSGGVDSALTSTLCALTEYPVAVVSLPIAQEKGQHSRSLEHIKWLKENFQNVKSYEVDCDYPDN